MFKRKDKKMSCEENREMISSFIDAELSPAEKEMLERHLGGCSKCRTLEEWLRCVKDGIRQSAASLTIPNSLRDKILRSLPNIPPKPDHVPWWKRLFVLLLLFCLSASPAFPWGPEGHEYINKSGALKAPVGLGGFPS